jgi:hypothetical protein
MTEVWWERLGILTAMEGINELRITVHPGQYNFAIGYYGKNRKRLMQNFREVIFLKNPGLKTSEFEVDYR